MAARIIDKITSDGRRLERILRDLDKKEVRIGFQRGNVTDENGVDMCDIAMWNELGTSHSPARPFMRQTVDNHESEINALLKQARQSLLGGYGGEQVLKEIGLKVKDMMQNEIINGGFVPNAASTIRKKGSDRPLIDTGRMRQSVNYEIKAKGERDE